MDQLQPLQSQPFSIRVLPIQDQVVRVRVSGEVDLCTAPELERALVQEIHAAGEVLLDLSGVSFIDSSGLRAIVGAARAAQSDGGALVLDSRLSDRARRVLEITGLKRLVGSSDAPAVAPCALVPGLAIPPDAIVSGLPERRKTGRWRRLL